nr:MAG TPA: hypothetical protein [Caudoviricetes sp.]
MGFFSWKTSDTKKSISNEYSDCGALPVYLITPDNEKIYEPNYDGYGHFGGFDAYALLAKWNYPELCNGDPAHDRRIGISYSCDCIRQDPYKQPEYLKYPLKFAEDPNLNYEDLEPAEECPYQGLIFNDED